MSLSEYSVIKREFNGNRSVPSNFLSDIEFSVITNDVIKSFEFLENNSGSLFGPTKVRKGAKIRN